ncbi:MAG: ribbon-helix-helix protein, CopG family [Thaumarchaeota archaeon]|nr:ribbon-helix-helix protein, CopG family [Nitrososphaerota archaeon]
MAKTVITFSCDVEDAEEIERYCRENGYVKSWFIRECVMQVVDGRVPLIPRQYWIPPRKKLMR